MPFLIQTAPPDETLLATLRSTQVFLFNKYPPAIECRMMLNRCCFCIRLHVFAAWGYVAQVSDTTGVDKRYIDGAKTF